MKVRSPALNPLFRSDTQGRLLAVLIADSDREHPLGDLARAASTSVSTASREIDRAEIAGIVSTRNVGKARLVRAAPEHPQYQLVSQLILATWGAPAILREELAHIAGVDRALIYGSWATRWHGHPGRAPNDIDVLVLGAPDRSAVDDAAERVEARIGGPVQVTIRPTSWWNEPIDPFAVELHSKPFYDLGIGSLVSDDQESTR